MNFSDTVLDIGFADNPRLHYLAHTKGVRGIGLDISTRNCAVQAQLSRALGNGNIYIAANATRLPLLPNSLDVAIATDILEHLRPADKQALAKELHRVLKPGGRLILKSPLEKDIPFSLNKVLHWWDPECFWEHRHKAGHFEDNAVSERELMTLMERNRLAATEVMHMNFLLDKIWDYTLPEIARRLLQGRSRAGKKRTAPPPEVDRIEPGSTCIAVPEDPFRPSMGFRLLAIAVGCLRDVLLLPDRLAGQLGWGNHVLSVFMKRSEE